MIIPLLHPSVTDPVQHDPVDYFPLPSENLVSPVPSEYFDFKYPAIFMLPQWLCGVTLKCPEYLQTNNK